MVGMAAAEHVSSAAVGGKQSFHQTVILCAYFNGIATVVLIDLEGDQRSLPVPNPRTPLRCSIGLLTGPSPEWIAHALSTLAPRSPVIGSYSLDFLHILDRQVLGGVSGNCPLVSRQIGGSVRLHCRSLHPDGLAFCLRHSSLCLEIDASRVSWAYSC